MKDRVLFPKRILFDLPIRGVDNILRNGEDYVFGLEVLRLGGRHARILGQFLHAFLKFSEADQIVPALSLEAEFETTLGEQGLGELVAVHHLQINRFIRSLDIDSETTASHLVDIFERFGRRNFVSPPNGFGIHQQHVGITDDRKVDRICPVCPSRPPSLLSQGMAELVGVVDRFGTEILLDEILIVVVNIFEASDVVAAQVGGIVRFIELLGTPYRRPVEVIGGLNTIDSSDLASVGGCTVVGKLDIE